MRKGHHARNGFLTAKGLEEAAQRFSLEGLASRDVRAYVDSPVSVSGLELERDLHVFDDDLLDQQYRRFHNGS